MLLTLGVARFASAQEEPRDPAVQWSVIIREICDCAPAIAQDGTLYFGTFTGKFWAIDKNGRTRWIFHAGREIKSSAALGQDGTIYFGCRDRSFYAVTPEGKKKWQFKTAAWVDSSPAVSDRGVYFGCWDKHFYALKLDGALYWKFQTGGPIVSSPALDREGNIFFGSHDGKFYALRPDGTRAWDFGAAAAVIASPALAQDGTIYCTSVGGNCFALDSGGTLKWTLKTGGFTASSPVIGQDGTIYLGVNEKLWAIEPDGKKKWEQPFSDGIETAPLALSDGSVWFLSGNGHLINLEVPHKFKWHRPMGWGTANFALGAESTLYAFGYVVNEGTVLYAFNTSSASLAASSWPKFRGNMQNTGRLP
jgi:outer membrane protein assembly factor BamB